MQAPKAKKKSESGKHAKISKAAEKPTEVTPKMPQTSERPTLTYGMMATKNPDLATKYTVAPPYDEGFLKNAKEVRARDLYNQYEQFDASELVAFDDDVDNISETVTPFIAGFVLKVSKPNPNNKEGFQFSKFTANGKLKKKLATTVNYKRIITFADINCPKATCFAMLEDTNERHNLWFQRDKSKKDFYVSTKVAILAPKILGKMKNGCILVTTDRPFEVFIARSPILPRRPLLPNVTSHDMTYFIMKGVKIGLEPNDQPIAIKTSCNSETCDRLGMGKNATAPCGCFHQHRNDSTAMNSVLKFSFSFKDGVDKVVRISDFTSLRTSRVFFHRRKILYDYEILTMNEVVTIIGSKFKQSIAYVNKQGGWTVVGWYVRALKEEDDKEERDEHLVHESLKINVSFLQPTKASGATIPEKHAIKAEDIEDAITATNDVAGAADDEY